MFGKTGHIMRIPIPINHPPTPAKQSDIAPPTKDDNANDLIKSWTKGGSSAFLLYQLVANLKASHTPIGAITAPNNTAANIEKISRSTKPTNQSK